MSEPPEFEGYIVDVTQMAWGEFRASAIKEGSFDRAIDGPYADTYSGALRGLREELARLRSDKPKC